MKKLIFNKISIGEFGLVAGFSDFMVVNQGTINRTRPLDKDLSIGALAANGRKLREAWQLVLASASYRPRAFVMRGSQITSDCT